MAMVSTTPVEIKQRYYKDDLRGIIDATWSASLKAEGIGHYTNEGAYTAEDEIDSLLDAYRLMSFYRNTTTAKQNRERFIISYAAPFYTRESLQNVIVPIQTFVPRVVRNVAMLYKDAAIRQLVQGEEEAADNALYQQYIKDAKINVRAKEWHRIYTLTDVVAVRPIIRQRPAPRLEYDVLSPDEFRVSLDQDNNVRKLLYTSSLYDDSGGITENIIVVWTDEHHYYRTIKGEEKTFASSPDGRNPYGIIPFVVMCRDEAEPFSGGLSSLVEANMHCNFLKMLESEDSAFAAISVPFGVNVAGRKDDFTFSPRTPIMIDADADVVPPSLAYISGSPHSEMLRDLQLSEERSAAMRQGMSSFMLSDTPTELSGKAMKIALTELRELRQDDAMVFEAYERDLYEKTVVVVNKEAGKQRGLKPLTGKSELFVDYAEQNFDDDPKAEYELDMMQTKDNVLSIVDVFRKWNTDMDNEEEVLNAIRENRRINSSIRVPERATRPGQDPTAEDTAAQIKGTS